MPRRLTLPSSLRARRDYLLFRFSRDWPYLLSVTGLVLGVLSLVTTALPSALPSTVLAVLTCVGFAGGALTFRRDRREQQELVKPIVVTASSGVLPPIHPSATYAGATVLSHPRLDGAIVHEQVDDALDGAESELEWQAEPFVLGDDLRATSVQQIGERLKRREIAFNGKVVRLSTDLVPAHLDTVVTVQRASYFDNICSNHLTRTRIRRVGGPQDADDSFFARYVVGPDGALRDLADQSRLANIVGVSTLAFVGEDVLIVNQSARSGASKDLLAPSGSGSLEPRDGLGAFAPDTLQALVRRGMERELREECNLPADTVLQTRLTGFARWLEFGGKPEFLGVTRIRSGQEATALHRGVSRAERPFAGTVTAVRLDLPALATVDPAGSLHELPGVPEHVLHHASMPLLLCLRALGRRLAHAPDFVPPE